MGQPPGFSADGVPSGPRVAGVVVTDASSEVNKDLDSHTEVVARKATTLGSEDQIITTRANLVDQRRQVRASPR